MSANPDAATVMDATGGAVWFAMPGLFGWLESATAAELDALPFGLIAMAPNGMVEHYNLTEARTAGLTPARIVGRHFFTSVAICTNNFMVAHRFEEEPALDAVIDYVFTFVMAPRRVRLRLLKQPGGQRIYLAIEPRGGA